LYKSDIGNATSPFRCSKVRCGASVVTRRGGSADRQPGAGGDRLQRQGALFVNPLSNRNVRRQPRLVRQLTRSSATAHVKIDIISAAMFATAARKEVIDSSDPVYTYGEGLLVPKTDTKTYSMQEYLKGEVVGAQVGTPS
jgi:ABC-type amino acid transport substrate-binding protein